jgi:TonB family protein
MRFLAIYAASSVWLACIALGQRSVQHSPEIVSVVVNEKFDVFVNGKPSKHYPDMSGTLIEMPKPDYPPELRRLHLRGRGIFRMYINEQGVVTATKIRKSTGRPELDAEALKALVRWRAKPGPRREIDEPIAFVLDLR